MNPDQNKQYFKREHPEGFGGNKIMAGLVVVTIGTVLLLQRMGYPIPGWILSWEMLLIAIGLYVGFRHSFRGIGWAIPMLIGTAFLVRDFYPDLTIAEYIWPLLIILLGLVIMFRPPGHRRRRDRRWERWNWQESYQADQSKRGDQPNPPKYDASGAHVSSEDFFDHTVIFGSQQKVIISKDFKGGDLTTFFGGASINFMQADIKDKAVLDVTQVFGGLEIIVPSHWKVQSDLVTIFGGVEHKKMGPPEPVGSGPSKVLVLDGTVIFGGIEIKSY